MSLSGRVDLRISGILLGECRPLIMLHEENILKVFRMTELVEQETEAGLQEGGVKLPSMEIARTFAVETINYPSPLGLQ